MKKYTLYILLCGLITLSAVGCGKDTKKENTTSNETLNSNITSNENTNKKYSECAKSGNTCTTDEIYDGQLVKVAINDNETRDFYVIKDDGNELTLISTIEGRLDSEWIISNDRKNVCPTLEDGKECGPYTAFKNLNEMTKDWTNIKNISNYEYVVADSEKNKIYKDLKINDGVTTVTPLSGEEYTIPGETKTRLITAEEVLELKKGSSSKIPEWLTEGVAKLYDSKEIKHFYIFTLSPSSAGYDTARVISCKYSVGMNKINVDSNLVLLPVITVEKSDIK